MKKYNKKLVWDYINGNYIENIEELEDNYDFMTDVIELSNDKNMINLCSKRLKKDYNFIVFILKKFKNDLELLEKVEEHFINKLDEKDPKYMELVYLLASLEDKYNPNSIYLKYLVKRQVIYLNSRIEYERIKQINPNLTTVSGLGFILIKMEVYKKYHYNKHILNYHATKLLEEIFYNNENREYNFEEFIHIKYSNPEVIKKIGIRTFIIDYVFNYDRCLGDYIAVNIDLIKNIEKKLKDIIDNYKQYEYNLILTKNSIFEEKALNIINDNLSYLSLEEICYYIYKEKNIKIPYLNELCLELEEFNDYNLTFLDRKTINEILKLAKEIYDKNTTITKLNMMEEYKYIEEKCESKVLEFKPNKSIGNS